MSAHDHSAFVEGCYRCELSRDEGGDGSPQLDLREALFNILGLAEPDAAAWQSAVAAIDTLLRERDALRGRVEELTEALRATADELSRWGMGDMHYGNQPQEPRVVAAVERARALVARVVPEKETP